MSAAASGAGGLVPLLRGLAAIEIARNIGGAVEPADATPVTVTAAAGPGAGDSPLPAPAPRSGGTVWSLGLAPPIAVPVGDAAPMAVPMAAPVTEAALRARAGASDMPAAMPLALAEGQGYGAFALSAEGGKASAATLVIFNAAMVPQWPVGLRALEAAGQDQAIRAAGAGLAQMSPEEAAEFLTKAAAAFGFLLTVKKRLRQSLKEERETVLGIFSLLGLGLETLVQGLRASMQLSLAQEEVLARVRGDEDGKGGKARRRLRL